jgi:hypothetical protein
MSTTYFSDSSGINTYLLPNNPIGSQAVIDSLYTDPFYGLSSPANYARWEVLRPNANTTALHEQLAF